MNKKITKTSSLFKKTFVANLLIALGAIGASGSSFADGCASKTWVMGNTYNLGDVVSSRGRNYKVIQAHTVYASNWNPENAPALWQDLGECTGQPNKGSGTPPLSKPAPKPSSPPPATTTPPAGITPKTEDASFPLTESQFNQLFPNRHEIYTYEGLKGAFILMKDFANVGDKDTKKRELAAFLANVGHETADLVYAEEINKSSSYCQAGGQYPCAPGKQYYGRGPLQLSWNYNYGTAGEALKLPLLANPEMVTDPRNGGHVTSWLTAMWFWMTQSGAGTMSAHNAMVQNKGFGETIRTINGALECNGGNSAQVSARVERYKKLTTMMDVDPGPNLSC